MDEDSLLSLEGRLILGQVSELFGAWSRTPIRDTSCCCHPLIDVPCLRPGPHRLVRTCSVFKDSIVYEEGMVGSEFYFIRNKDPRFPESASLRTTSTTRVS